MKAVAAILGVCLLALCLLVVWRLLAGRSGKQGDVWLASTGSEGRDVRYGQRITLPTGRSVRSGFIVHLPAGYADAAGPWPLVVFLHGYGESGNNLDEVAATGLARRAHEVDLPFIVLAPQCPREDDWTYKGQLKRVMGLVDFVVATYRVDPRRIYLTGNSMGGYAVWSLAYRYPHRFAAIVPICGSTGTGVAPAIKHIPAWVFHGARDQAISVNASRKIVAALRACDAPVRYTEYADGAHNVWDRAYRSPELFDWLLRQRRPVEGAQATEP